MKKIIPIIFICLLPIMALGQDRKGMQTAKMNRAIQAYNNRDIPEMKLHLNREISENPNNGYAYAWLAYAQSIDNEYKVAIDNATKALKYIPKKDKDYIVFAFDTRAKCYKIDGDYEKCLLDLNSAINAKPDNHSLYDTRGQFYYEQAKYDLSDKDYQKYIKLSPNDAIGYMGIGRNMLARNQYNNALDLFNKAVLVSGESNSYAYCLRAQTYISLKRIDDAASDIVSALAIDGNNNAFALMMHVADSSYLTITSRLLSQRGKDPENPKWSYCLGIASMYTQKYKKALEYLSDASKKDSDAIFKSQITSSLSNCYMEMCEYNKAMQIINDAINREPDNIDYRGQRVEINYRMGKMNELYNDLDYCIEKEPMNFMFYYRRGWFKSLD